METRICKQCNQTKNITAFSVRTVKGKKYRRYLCSGCQSRNHREKYPEVRKAISKRGKTKYNESVPLLKQAMMEHINQYSCKICRITDNRVLSFHHREPELKNFTIAWAFTHSYCLETLLPEAEKCDLLCLNCHMISHYKGNNQKRSCHILRAKRAREMKWQLMQTIQQLKCKECDEEHLAALAFHHRDPSTKSFKLAEKLNNWKVNDNMEILFKEAEKCDILCHNCHIIHHLS